MSYGDFWYKKAEEYIDKFTELEVYVPIGRHDLGTSPLHSLIRDLVDDCRIHAERNKKKDEVREEAIRRKLI